jgi:hypothetical protein
MKYRHELISLAATDSRPEVFCSCAIASGLSLAVTHLDLGRAYARSDDKVKARAAYQDFLGLWKDADPDIPVLKEAKAEFARLHCSTASV